MNRLRGVIKSVEFDDYLSFVYLDTEIGPLYVVLVDIPIKTTYLQVGRQTTVMFNPTVVKLSKGYPFDVLVDNIIQCEVFQIKEGKILSAIILKSGGLDIVCYTTTESIHKNSLQPAETVFAMISPMDIMIEG